ncbi:MAG TPA: hypothetical protein VLD18_04115, partial [Verrucomicrobiae bacterium]|nr:hypothetical protein [Verrucomicrobiae bacterium]
TAGFANPIVSTVELGGAVTAAAVSVLMPLVALLMVFAILFWLLRGKGSRSATQNAPLEGTVT